MLSRGVLVFCTVLFLRDYGDCLRVYLPERDSSSRPYIPPYISHRISNPYPPYSFYPPLVTTTEAEKTTPEKEYGEESKKYDQNYKKYYVSAYNNEVLDWWEARDKCKERGMVLACPTTSSEEMDLENYLREHALEPEDEFSGYWIGGYRLTSYNTWTWICNDKEIKNFGWYPEEPNFVIGEDCVELKKELMYGWNNHYCELSKRYICESLPRITESDKNIVQDLKDSLHEEIAKDDKNNIKRVNATESVQSVFRDEQITKVTTLEMPLQTQHQEYLTEPQETTTSKISQFLVTYGRHTESHVSSSEEAHNTNSSSTTVRNPVVTEITEITTFEIPVQPQYHEDLSKPQETTGNETHQNVVSNQKLVTENYVNSSDEANINGTSSTILQETAVTEISTTTDILNQNIQAYLDCIRMDEPTENSSEYYARKDECFNLYEKILK